MLPTPSTLHVPFDRVYEPAEDSYLLLDTLSSHREKAFLKDRFTPTRVSEHGEPSESTNAESTNEPSFNGPLITEIGTGSGVVLAFVTANASVIFGHSDISTIGVDINVHACRATEETVKISIQEQQNKGIECGKYLGNVLGDLDAPLTPGCVDVLIFNPPYVPTAELPHAPKTTGGMSVGNGDTKTTFEEDSHFLELSYAGGIDGMETTNRLLESLPKVLSKRGVAYILLCAQNKPEDVKGGIRAWGDRWLVETVGSSGKKAGWEVLQIIRIWRDSISTSSA